MVKEARALTKCLNSRSAKRNAVAVVKLYGGAPSCKRTCHSLVKAKHPHLSGSLSRAGPSDERDELRHQLGDERTSHESPSSLATSTGPVTMHAAPAQPPWAIHARASP